MTRIEYEVDRRRMLRKNENVLRHEVSFGKYNFISLVTKDGILFCEAWIFSSALVKMYFEFRKEKKQKKP
jgi:hypothetical protein